MATYSSTLTINELNADRSINRSCTLRGPGLPLMGASWPFENKIPTEWNPGNQDEATQHVMGRREMPSEWSGEWNKTRMVRTPSTIVDDGDASDVSDPTVLHDFLTLLFSSGRRLQVIWSTEQQPDGNSRAELQSVPSISYSIVREGRCERFEPKFKSVFDIEWSVRFVWVSRGKTTTKVANPRDETVNNNASAYNAALQAIIDSNQAAADASSAPTSLTLGQLEQLANTPSVLANDVSRSMLQLESGLANIVQLAQTLASQPAQIARIAIDHARNTMATAQSCYQQLSSLGVETLSTQDDLASILRAQVQFAQTQQASQAAANAAFIFLVATRKAVPVHAGALTGEMNPQSAPDPSTIQAIYVVKQGDTLHKISMRFYSNPDHGDDICRANGLSDYTPTLPVGKVLVVPRISSTTQVV